MDKNSPTVRGLMDISYRSESGVENTIAGIPTIGCPGSDKTIISAIELVKYGYFVNFTQGILVKPCFERTTLTKLVCTDGGLQLPFKFAEKSLVTARIFKKRRLSEDGAEQQPAAFKKAKNEMVPMRALAEPVVKPPAKFEMPCSLQEALTDPKHGKFWLDACATEIKYLFGQDVGPLPFPITGSHEKFMEAKDLTWQFHRISKLKRTEVHYRASLVRTDAGNTMLPDDFDVDLQLFMLLLVSSWKNGFKIHISEYKLPHNYRDSISRTFVRDVPGAELFPDSLMLEVPKNSGYYATKAILPGSDTATNECIAELAIKLKGAGFLMCKNWRGLFARKNSKNCEFILATSSQILLFYIDMKAAKQSETLFKTLSPEISLQPMGALRTFKNVQLTPRGSGTTSISQCAYKNTIISRFSAIKKFPEAFETRGGVLSAEMPDAQIPPENSNGIQAKEEVLTTMKAFTSAVGNLSRTLRPDLQLPYELLKKGSNYGRPIDMQLCREVYKYLVSGPRKNQVLTGPHLDPAPVNDIHLSIVHVHVTRPSDDLPLIGYTFGYSSNSFEWHAGNEKLKPYNSSDFWSFPTIEQYILKAFKYQRLVDFLYKKSGTVRVFTTLPDLCLKFLNAGWSISKQQGQYLLKDEENDRFFTIEEIRPSHKDSEAQTDDDLPEPSSPAV